MSKDAEESYQRNVVIVKDLIKLHDRDITMVCADVVMQLSIVFSQIENKDAARLLATFAIEAVEEIKDNI
jgi:hypothetical protein